MCAVAVAGCAGISKTLDSLGLEDEAQDAPSGVHSPAALHLRGRGPAGARFALDGPRLAIDLADGPRRLRERIIGERVLVRCGGLHAMRPWPAAQGDSFAFGMRPPPGAHPPSARRRPVDRCAVYPVPGARPIAEAAMRAAR